MSEPRKRKATNQLAFGPRLRMIMDQRRLTVRGVAELAGVRSSVIQSWITRAAPQDLEAVARLAKALNLGFKELLLGEPEEIVTEAFELDGEDLFDGICKIKIQRVISKIKQ